MRNLKINREKEAEELAGAGIDSGNSASMVSIPAVLQGMSHEVRTHMNAIVAFSYLMTRNGCDRREREEFSNQILTSCEQLIGLLDSFLDSAIIDSGVSESDFKICKFNTFLDDLLCEFRAILNKEAYRELTLVTECGSAEASEILIDTNRVFRVIRNLFQNALKNTRSGYVKIGYYHRDDQLIFYVLDSGQGYFKCREFLHTSDLNEALAKYDDTSSAINLTLAKKLIHSLGGTIRVECNGLTGTGVYFSIPAKVIESSDIEINKYISTMIAI